MTLREQIADWVTRLGSEDITPELDRRVRDCMLDLFGVALGGSGVGIAPMARSLFIEQGGAPQTTVWGYGERLPAPQAAMVNAIQAHTLDMDDGHRYANAHPAVAVIPAAVAAAELMEAKPESLCLGIVAGYEVLIRLGTLINPGHLLKGFHTTATIGPFAAAAACSRIMGLDAQSTAQALSLAGLQSAGLLEALTSGQMSKPFQVGKAVQSGVLAALLASRGAEGPLEVFEGQKGFFAAFTDGVEPPATWSAEPEELAIFTSYFKKHAACRHIHSTLDALNNLVSQHGIETHEIEKIEVDTYSIAHRLAGQHTGDASGIAAKFSIPVSIGLLLARGKSGPDAYWDEVVTDPAVQKLADKVAITVNPERDKVYPSQRSSTVILSTANGNYTHEVLVPRGDPENPFTRAELIEKFKRNAEKLLSSRQAAAAAELILNQEGQSMGQLVRSLSPN
jgi:2-methylcitrate dehydratase PrpD